MTSHGRRLLGYIRPRILLLSGTLALVILVSAVQLLQPYLIKLAVDRGITPRDLEQLLLLAGAFSLTLLFEFALRFAQLYSLEKLGQDVVYALRTELFEHIQSLASSFFDRHPVGKLVSRVTSDVDAIHEAFTSGVVMILADLVKLAAIVVILLKMDWRLALVTFAIIPPMGAASLYFRLKVRRSYRRVRALVADLNGAFQENVTGMRLVQLFRRERRHAKEFDEINREHRAAELTTVRYESVFSALTELLGSFTLAAIIWAGGWRFIDGAVTFGTLVAFIEYSRRFFRPLQELSQRYTVMQAALAAAERIFQLLDTRSAIASPEVPERPTQARGAIRFEGVRFGYGDGDDVVREISLNIEPGERIGIVGWTGSGKSTLVKLLTRLYDVRDGAILLDGVDIRRRDLQELRRSVGVVLQEPFLFAGSIRSNITLGDPSIDDERMIEAARAVRADRFIEALPDGYSESVRERGSNLSTGEKQLICFARALAFDPGVVVLDEATASVDPQTEAAIQRALETLLADRTSITIAHRLATIRSADRIVVMHRGRIAEIGSHDELLAEGGIYHTLHELQ